MTSRNDRLAPYTDLFHPAFLPLFVRVCSCCMFPVGRRDQLPRSLPPPLRRWRLPPRVGPHVAADAGYDRAADQEKRAELNSTDSETDTGKQRKD